MEIISATFPGSRIIVGFGKIGAIWIGDWGRGCPYLSFDNIENKLKMTIK
jgi:hypothetical protein